MSEVMTDESQALVALSECLREGGVVILPTETVYGLAACAGSSKAIERMSSIKGIVRKSGFAVHLSDTGQAENWLPNGYGSIRRVMRELWPGPLTIRLNFQDRAQSLQSPSIQALRKREYHVVLDNLALALRVPQHAATQEILASVGKPVVMTGVTKGGGDAST